MEDARLQVSHTLQSSIQSNGSRRYATPPQQVAAFNKRVVPEDLQQPNLAYVKPEVNVETVYGDNVICF